MLRLKMLPFMSGRYDELEYSRYIALHGVSDTPLQDYKDFIKARNCKKIVRNINKILEGVSYVSG